MNDSATGIFPACEPVCFEEVEDVLNKFLEDKNSSVMLIYPDGGYIEVSKGCKFIGIKMPKDS